MRKILIATTTRADWGLLSPIARELSKRADCSVGVMATNMHLDPLRGNTLEAIKADGFDPIVAPMPVDFATPEQTAAAMGACLASAAKVMETFGPDLLVVLGDRFETLAIAEAAVLMRVPVAHLHGGELTEGAFDDSFRHAITKLSALHLTATEQYRRRVIQLGESPAMVHNVGAIGVAPRASVSREELECDLGWTFGAEALLLTLHPETLGDISAAELAEETFEALREFPLSKVLITYPNNDLGAEQIIAAIKRFEAANHERVKVVPSLGAARYFSALRCVRAVVGNSSSGIIEVPSAGIPTVNIGNRQARRVAADSVINCRAERGEIAAAIRRALSADCSGVVNPYFREDTLERIVSLLAETPIELLRKPKSFCDL